MVERKKLTKKERVSKSSVSTRSKPTAKRATPTKTPEQLSQIKASKVAPEAAPENRILRRQPSQVTDEFWLFAYRQQGTYPGPTPRSGKWLIFVSREAVDELWRKISDAIAAGQLGDSAKVSTARSNPNATDSSQHVICVYTYDSDDVDDARRIRQALRELGVDWRTPYKADQATYAGHYRARGYQRISKYYE